MLETLVRHMPHIVRVTFFYIVTTGGGLRVAYVSLMRVQYIARVAYRERWSRARGYAYGLVHACLTCDALHNSYILSCEAASCVVGRPR